MTLSTKITADSEREQGITLLLSILIMSGIFLISITVSFFVIQEIRSSRASLLTEPAIIAADAGAEEGVWVVKRGDPDSLPECNPDVPSGTSLGANVVAAKCRRYSQVTLDLVKDQQTTLYFYDPEDVNGNVCMRTSYTEGVFLCPSGYQIFQSISLAFSKGSVSVKIDARTLDGYSFPDWTDRVIATPGPGDSPIGIDVPATINPSSVDSRFTLTITPTEDITVTVDATGRKHDGTVRNGLPDYPTVDSMGCASRGTIGTDCTSSNGDVYRRRLNVTVPR